MEPLMTNEMYFKLFPTVHISVNKTALPDVGIYSENGTER